MTTDDNSKLVATIAARSPIAFEPIDQSTQEPENNDPPANVDPPSDPPAEPGNVWAGVKVGGDPQDPPADPPADPPQPPANQDPPADPPADPTPPPPSDAFKDYSDAALAASVLAEKRNDMFGGEVAKDLGWEGFVDGIDKYITETLQSGRDYQLKEIGDAQKYVDFLLSGGDPRTLATALQNSDVTDLDLTKATPEQLEQVIRAEYKARGTESDADMVIESLKVKEKLGERAASSQEFLKAQRDHALEADKARREQAQADQLKQRERIQGQINKAIAKDNVLGYDIDDQLRDELKTMIFQPTVTMNVPQADGSVVEKKVPEFVKLQDEFNKDIEKQVAFAILLKKGFDLSNIVAQGQNQKNSDLMATLRARGQKASMPKVSNGYLRDQ